jgi:hypothetical protein
MAKKDYHFREGLHEGYLRQASLLRVSATKPFETGLWGFAVVRMG